MPAGAGKGCDFRTQSSGKELENVGGDETGEEGGRLLSVSRQFFTLWPVLCQSHYYSARVNAARGVDNYQPCNEASLFFASGTAYAAAGLWEMAAAALR